MNIEEKKARISQLNEELKVRETERRQLKQEVDEEQSAFKVGDKISFTHGNTKKEGRIKAVLGASFGDNSYIVIPKRKDGSDGSPVKLYWFDAKKAKLID